MSHTQRPRVGHELHVGSPDIQHISTLVLLYIRLGISPTTENCGTCVTYKFNSV